MNYNSYTQKPICEVFGEIPVSPLLKRRVRQRLYSLVNDIDGYTPNKNNNLDDDLNCIYHGKIIDLCCGLNNCKIDKSSKGYQNEDSIRIDKNQNDASINSLEGKLQPKINKDDFSETKIMVDSFVSKFCDVLEDVYSSNEKENISDLVLRFKHYIDEVMEAVTSLDSKLAYLEHEFHSANEKHERDFEFLRSFISDQKKENIGNSKWENKMPVQSSKKDINTRQIQKKLNFLREEIAYLRFRNQELRVSRKALKNERKKAKIKTSEVLNVIGKTTKVRKDKKQNKQNIKHSSSSLSADDDTFLREYKGYIVAQLMEYKKALQYLKKKSTCSRNI